MKMADVVRIGEPGKVEGIEEPWIRVPEKLAWALGLVDGGEVFFYLIRSIHYAPNLEGAEPKMLVEYQLLATPINPDIWQFLYNIEFRLGDEPGSFAAVASIFKDLGISCQVGESRTYLVDVRAECCTTVYFQRFKGSIGDLDNEFEKRIGENPELRKKIKPWKTKVTKGGKERETWITGKKSPLNTMHIQKTKEFGTGTVGKKGEDIRIVLGTDDKTRKCRRMNESYILPIPQSIIDRVKESFNLEEGMSIVGSTVIIVMDADLRGLWITFVRPSANVASVEFYLEDKIGAIASVSAFLGKKGVNLLETRINTLVFSRIGLWRVIADFGEHYPRGRNALERELRNDMRNVDGLQKELTKIGKESPIHVLASFTETSQEEMDTTAHKLIGHLEKALRRFISRTYEKNFGEEWWRKRIPGGIRDRVEKRLEEGGSPMQHCYFPDYAQIMSSKTGQRIFPDLITLPQDLDFERWDKPSKLQYIAQRLKELEPVRNAVAHHREITADQLNRLEAYTEEILRAISKEG